MANETRYFKTPFAESGTRTEVPNTSVGGAVGFDTGFGSDYELPQGSAGRKRIERDKYNGLHHSITKNLKQWQENLYPTWIEDDGTGVAYAYSVGMIVNHSGQGWISNEAANQEEPGTGTKWSNLSGQLKPFENVASMIAYAGHAIGNKYSTGRTTWEVTATVGVPLGAGLYATSITPVDPIDFGADPTGVTDSTLAFTDASLYASTSIQWSYGTYKLKDYNILENQHIVSYGATITPLDNTSTAVIANTKSGWSLTGKTTFKGSRATLGDLVDTGECGLRIINGDDFKVENVNFVRFKGLAFDRQGVTGAVTEYYGNRGQYNNILMFENLQGGKDSAEYEVYTNLNVIANVKGFESVGGNISWDGGNCTNNTDGFLITTGPNNAHGIATGVHFNHNTDRNIYINRTGDGFTFEGCHSYANDATGSGKIEIVQSGGIDFHGGAYDCWFEVDETFVAGIGDNLIRDIFAPGGYGNLKIFNHLGNRAATMLTSGIRGAGAINSVDGLNVNDVAPIAFLVKRVGSSSQTLTDSVETVMTFPEIRPMGDTRAALPVGTISSFPTPYKGYYSINLDAVIAGTTLDADASYIAVYVDGVNQGYFYGRSVGVVAGKSGMKFTISAKAYAESTIQFKAYAVGSGLVHAISVFDSKVEVLLINS